MENFDQSLEGEFIKENQKKKGIISNYIEVTQRFVEGLPEVLEAQKNIEYFENTLKKTPEFIKNEVLTPEWLEDYKHGTEILENDIGLPRTVVEVSYAGTAGSAVDDNRILFDKFMMVPNTLNPIVPELKVEMINDYKAFQEKSKVVEKVKKLLGQLDPALVVLLENAERSVRTAALPPIGKKSTAGKDMRNVLNDYKGVLIKKAGCGERNKPHNKKWDCMIHNLVISEDKLPKLIDHREKWATLQSILSDLDKENPKGLEKDIELVWAELITHLNVVLSLVRLD